MRIPSNHCPRILGRYTFGHFRLDQVEGALYGDQGEVSLRPKSLAVLEHLVRNVGRLITKKELLAAVWSDTYVGEAVLKACVTEIRRALGDSSETPRFIETLRGRGYRFIGSTGIGNLPNPKTSFVGRERELRAVRSQLTKGRLVTLHGPPGTGKTRLAGQLAAELREEMPHGVWWIDVAAVSDPNRVAERLAGVLGIHDQPSAPLADTLVQALHERRLLVVLDNCEHLVAACASLADDLLGGCPNLKILATSREPLRIPGERVWPVPTLSMPDVTAQRGALLRSEAARLFTDRAIDACPSFAISDGNAPAIALICQRLDGLPLAIELAAARVRTLTPDEIAARLDRGLVLLNKGHRTDPTRHQTLTAALDWSFDLLSAKERRLFTSMSIFSGSCTLAAAESVCGGHDLRAEGLLELMAALVDHSLVKVVTNSSDKQARYRLLHTVGLYAHENLSPEEEPSLAKRHAQFFLTVAEQNGPFIHSVGGDGKIARLRLESDNLDAALAWTQKERDRGEIGLRICAALWLYWMRSGQHRVGRYWLENTLKQGGDAPVKVRAEALHALGTIVRAQGDIELARSTLEQSVAMWRTTDEVAGLGATLTRLGAVMATLGALPEAEGLIEEGMTLLRHGGNAWELAIGMRELGEVAQLRGRAADAVSLFEGSVAILQKIPDPWLAVVPIGNLAKIAADKGHYDQADEYWRRCLVLLESLEDDYLISYVLEGLAQTACRRTDYIRATRLFGMVVTVRETARHDWWFADSEDLVRKLRKILGDEAFDGHWADGHKLSLKKATAQALS